MWLKNLQIYRLATDWNISAERLDEQLAEHVFRPCGSMDMQSKGWLPPHGGESLAYALNGQIMVALGVEQKLLPGAVVKQAAAERIAEIEEQQGYSPSRKQAREIRELVAMELLPRAFARRRTTYAWIDPVRGWLCIDAASVAKAEEVLEMLNQCVSDLPLSALRTERSPAAAMTEWLTTGEAPAGFSIDRDCELRSPLEENATVRYVRHPLDGEEIGRHLAAGKQPTRLALTWDDRISFVLTEKMEIKRLAFLDILKEEAEAGAETADEQFDADFTLMTGELARLLPAIVAALGGEHVS
jgi:recombination associated protein RdgC